MPLIGVVLQTARRAGIAEDLGIDLVRLEIVEEAALIFLFAAGKSGGHGLFDYFFGAIAGDLYDGGSGYGEGGILGEGIGLGL